MPNYYEPAEDTFLLLKNIQKHLRAQNKKLSICEIGVGSGYILKELEKEFSEHSYSGSDINPDAIKQTQQEITHVELVQGSLFEPFQNKKFDLIYFNTPYLPCEDGEKLEDLNLKDRAIYGGRHGYETILKFINNLSEHLKSKGMCFMLFSSLSYKDIIDEGIRGLLLEFEEVAQENYCFEKLLAYKITKSNILKELEKLKITNLKRFNKGKHSKVLEGSYKDRKVMIKVGEEQFLDKEALFLNKLADENFTSSLLFSGKEYVVYKKIEGILIVDFFERAKKNELKKVLQNILDVCYRLDELKIQKFEMTNPYKHIFVLGDLSIKMIDFERSIYSENPKNTRQILDFFRRNIPNFEKKGLLLNEKKLLRIGKELKENLRQVKIEDLIK